MKKIKHLNDFLIEAETITEKFIQNFKISKLSPELYIKSVYNDFTKELSKSCTDFIHKSIVNGLDEKSDLIKNMNQISIDCTLHFKNSIK